jgi:hypothetical protein
MTSFLDLPAELRIDIYGYLIGSLDGALTSARLKEYRSFLLSCSQVHNELEAEALKVTNAFLAQVQSAWTITAAPLHLPTLTKLSDTVSIPIGVPGAVKIFHYESVWVPTKRYYKLRPYISIGPLIDSLVNSLPSFCLFMCTSAHKGQPGSANTRHFAFHALDLVKWDVADNDNSARHCEVGEDKSMMLYDANWRDEVWRSRRVFRLAKEIKRAAGEKEAA